MKRAITIAIIATATIAAVAAIWFWALRPLGFASYLSSTEATDVDIIHQYWPHRVVQPEWIAATPDALGRLMKWHLYETIARLSVVGVLWLVITGVAYKFIKGRRLRPNQSAPGCNRPPCAGRATELGRLRIKMHAYMRSILSILPIMALLAGCHRRSHSETAETTNVTHEQSAKLMRREKEKAGAWFSALDAARPSAPHVVEFVRLFPAAMVKYSYFTTTGEPGFDVEVDLHERYELAMQLPVNFDPEGRTVVGYGEPTFYLFEADRQNGRETIQNPSGERHFGSAEWRKIVESGGDFAAIGYVMITNRPVAGFKDRRRR